MKILPKNRSLLPAWIVILLGLLVTVSTMLFNPQVATAVSDPAIIAVQQAWDKAQQSNSYAFDSHVEQTSYPLPALSNVGRQPQIDDFYLSGQRDQAEDLLEMTLWQHARGSAESGISVRSQNGRTFRQNAAGEWEEQNEIGDLFAPGGDPLTFLQTAQNITSLGQDSRELSGLTFTYEKYSFDLDTTAYARILRQQLDAQLAQYGVLPAGMTLETPDIYRKMSGQGELWLDENGLPHRLEMTLTIPPQGNDGQAVVRIVTDLSGFDLAQINAMAVPVWQSPQTWVQTHQAELITGTQRVTETAVLLIIGVGLLLIILTHWRTHRFYTTVASLITMSMLFSPVLQVAQAADFQGNLQTAQAASQKRQAEAEAQADLQTELEATDFLPHDNPLATSNTLSTAALAPALTASNAVTDTTDTDGDGLILDEAYWGTCPYLGAPEGCTDVTDATDTDDDGLSDGVEVNDLGTNPDNADTDLDSIPDNLEIAGFVMSGQTWYLNPLEEDSNKDGLIDGLECRIRTTIVPAEFDPVGICPDTDLDGVPDVFDDDNDGDGVRDAQDVSPFTASSSYYDKENPLHLSIDNLAVDKPVFVEFQLRPQTAVNLNLYNHVLDWPSQDTEGQIQRLLDTTWADTDNLDIRSNTPNAANGDIRLVPMLEVTMPYTDGHYANLPITITAPITRSLSMTVGTWLDADQLNPFNISVNDMIGTEGTLNAYLPLTQVTDRYGTPEAFAARMLYRPAQGTTGRADWGADHEVRLIWFVQMITDQCPDGYDEFREDNNGDITYGCMNPETGTTAVREDVLTIGHVYPDTWQLTGLTVSEEHDLDVAIMYEDPTQDADLTAEDQLTIASWNLNNGFLIGRDCDTLDGNGVCQGDGNRDVTVDNMETAVSSWFTDTYYINTETHLDYEHGAYLGYIIGNEVQPLLNTAFGNYTTTIPTLLYAHDYTNRSLNLDDLTNNSGAGLISENGNAYQFDLRPDDVVLATKSTISWMPYQYVDGSWQAADLENYLTRLDNRLQEDSYFQPADDSEAAAEEAELKRTWVQLYYASLWQGLSTWTEMDTVPLNARPQDPDIPDAAFEPTLAPGTDFGATLLALAFLELFDSATRQNPFTQLSFRGVSPALFMAAFAGAIAVTWIGLGLMIAGMITGDKQLVRTGQIILAVINLVVVSVYAVNALYAVSLSVQGIASQANQATNYQALGVVGLVISLTIVWAFFIFQLISKDMNEVSTSVMASVALATTVVYAVLFLISIIGLGILGILLSLVDSIFLLMGKKGPTQYLVEFIARTLYDIDLSLTNLDSSNRLDIQLQDMGFADETEGFRVSNSLIITMGITNTIKYHRDFEHEEEKVRKRNIFSYTLQTEPIPFAGDLSYWDTSFGQWHPLNGRVLRTSSENEITVPLSTAGTGINQHLGVYYSEAFRSGYRACWNIPIATGVTIKKCSWKDFKDTVHYPLSQTLTFDIFPETVTQFARMEWSDTSPTIPEQVDYDADGLSDLFGTDPDYDFFSGFDADGDGLGDLYEISNGYNAALADGDYDGLSDRDELFYGTNPFVADTDGDGLNDRVETVDGWLIPYNGNQLTRVWSDPLSVDSDEDGLSDRDEFIFGFNPWAATDPSRILNLVQFDNLGVVEAGAPELLLHFEDADNSTAFYDSSGSANHASCEGSACPTVNDNGRYGQALQFDGIDDYVEASFILNPADTNFTAAMWFKASDFSNVPFLMRQTGGSGAGRAWFTLTNDGRVYTTLGDNALYGTTSVALDSWHHAAVTFDGTTLNLYLDGVLENQAPRTMESSTGVIWLGRHTNTARFLDGAMDDVVILDQALSSSKIGDLMNGRFNPSDNFLAPDTNLTYQATVTNTSVTTATGFLVAENNYFAPELRHPAAAYGLDADQRLAFFANDTGEENSATCVDNGTCPFFGLAGRHGDGLTFTDSYDVVTLPTITADASSSYGNFNLSFWINPATLPTSGQQAMLLDTESTENGAIDIYLNDSGKLVWDIVGDPFSPRTSNGTIGTGSWTHISLNGHYTLYLNGSLDQSDNVWVGETGFQIGNGRLANSLDGSQPFDGQMDEFVYFNASMSSYITDIRNGNYGTYIDPAILYRFDSPTLGYENLANDVRSATCPSVIECPFNSNGRYQQGITYDGTNDYLDLGFVFNPAVEPFSTALWFNVTDFSNRPIILQQLDGSGTGRAWFYLEADGTLRSKLGNVVLASATAVTANNWHHAAITYDGTTLQLYLDGILENSAIISMEASDGDLWLGRHKSSATQYFAGVLDELVIVQTAVDADAVQLLMDSSWPMIDILTEFEPFSATALSNQYVSGIAPVSPYAVTSQHRFDQEVEAALVLQAEIEYPVIDGNSANLELFIPFEDGPGSTVFDNLISYPQPNSDPDVEALCSGGFCPTAGLRGQVERAAYFDGLNDYLAMDFEPLGFGYGPDIHSIAVWVNASQGTILSTAEGGQFAYELELDVHELTTIGNPGDTPASTTFDAPRNKWFHLAVTIDGSDVARIYVNGSEVATGTHEYTERFKRLYIGMNSGGQDFLQGYLDDLRLYDVTLSPADVLTLYQESAPLMRFEFDEDEGAMVFTDNSVNEYIGQPRIESCTTLIIDSLTIDSLATTPSTAFVDLGNTRLVQAQNMTAGEMVSPTVGTVICSPQTLGVGVIVSGTATVLETAVVNPSLPGSSTQTFISGDNAITLEWMIDSEPIYQPNPSPGTSGRIGNGVLLDGTSYVEVDAPDVAALTDSFTIIGWIKPSNLDGHQQILSASRENSEDGYDFKMRDSQLGFSAYNVKSYYAPGLLQNDVWQQVAVVFDSNYDATFYIDGDNIGTISGSSTQSCMI